MDKYKLEIACFNLESAIIAQQNEANRIELCANMKEGGTTPDFELVQKVRQEITTDLNIMIRPRGGDFVYSDVEFEQMKTEIIQFKKLHIDGFVFGVLKENGEVNKEQNKELVALALPFPCTFHRAFDEVHDKDEALETIIECGFETILTSGLAKNVNQGIDILNDLVKKAKSRIVIMPGGGLRSSNVAMVKSRTKAHFYHSSAITDSSEIANGAEIKAILADLNS